MEIWKPRRLVAGFLLVLALLTGAVLAAPSAEDIKKFPAISGDVSGVAIPGLKSIFINDKQIKVQPDNTFATRVNLKAGEKYLILKINYTGLRVIKKYLVLRSEKSKQFKVFVPKTEIETPLKVAKAINKPGKKKRVKTREEIERLKAEIKAKELAEKLAKEKKTYDFSKDEFEQGTETLRALSTAIVNDQYGMKLKSPIGTLTYLKEILRTPNFYDYWKKRWGDKPVSAEILHLVNLTRNYRNKPFAQLTPEQQLNILKLNRLLLELTYPGLCPISELKRLVIDESWMSEVPLKNNGYIYVWEFSHGKLLVLKVVSQKFSADIYIPATEEWFSLQDLSYQELKELIAKPIWELDGFYTEDKK
ncbi:MAG: hypothetical protein WC772_00630 [Candidatus Margulisiibacteriota bacterium]|jgi:uncharacterized protein YueI